MVWERFPKFVLGFFAASVVMTVVTAEPPADYVGTAKVKGTFKSGAEKIVYDADFAGYAVPSELAGRFAVGDGVITFAGRMTLSRVRAPAGRDRRRRPGPQGQGRRPQAAALRSDWYEGSLVPKVVGPIKNLRSWAFVLCFLCIGLSTRFADLLTFGLKPFWAFTIGVAVNVPLGYFLSTAVFLQVLVKHQPDDLVSGV